MMFQLALYRISAVCGLVCCVAVAQGFAPSFSRVDWLVGSSPSDCAIADLDGDGDGDVVVAADYEVRVFLSDGQGGFTAAPSVSQSGLNVEDLALGDINGDGWLDAVGIDRPSEMLAVCLGNNSGGFAAASLVPVGLPLKAFEIGIAVADFNSDGLADVALSGSDQNGALVMLSAGGGSFGTPTTYGYVDQPTSVEVGDVDGDGQLDLVLPDYHGISTLLGAGDGTFSQAVLSLPGVSMWSATLADLDGDGRDDACVTSSATFNAMVLRSSGLGAFTLESTLPLASLGLDVVNADFSRDGKIDLAVCVFVPGKVATFLGGASPFQFTASTSTAVVSPAFRFASGDFHEDAAPDMVVLSRNVGTGLSVLFNETEASQAGFSYCSSKPNSQGCLPTLSGSGVSSVSFTSGFAITANQLLNQRSGLMLYGSNGPIEAPFKGGSLCVRPPVRRTAQQNSGGSPSTITDCSGSIALDFNAFTAGLAGGAPAPELSIIGTEVACQVWSRDPASTFACSLSNGYVFSVGP